jgi:hypothetical protein
MNDLDRRDDRDDSGASLVPTAVPLATGGYGVPPRKPRWAAKLAKPIAYGLFVVALGVVGVVAVGRPRVLVKATPALAPASEVPTVVAPPPETTVSATPPMVNLDQDTIRWHPPLQVDSDMPKDGGAAEPTGTTGEPAP